MAKSKNCTACGQPGPEEEYDRACISIPMELSVKIRTHYPYMEFSAMCKMLLMYADAAGFVEHLSEIDPNAWEKARSMRRGKPISKSAKAARDLYQAAEIVATNDEIEEFGV